MTAQLTLALVGAGGATGGFLVAWLILSRLYQQQLSGQSGQREVEIARLEGTIEFRESEIAGLGARLAEATSQLDQLRAGFAAERERASRLETRLAEQQVHHQEKLKLLEGTRARLNEEFRNLANDIFEAKQNTFREQSHAQLDGLLKPLSERIRDFEKRVETTYSEEARERFSLAREVRSLQELNARISRDAINLTNALKGENKTQGTWGEVILERVLERSGLVKGQEYDVQVSLNAESGRRFQPDVVVHLPDGKDVIVDSKVSLVAYERMCSAESPEAQQQALKQHVQSLRQHVRQLADKDYQQLDGLQTLDFVLLFVPVEAAFGVAVQHDTGLFSDAFERNIMVVSPSTLLATLRMIHNVWRFDQQNRNAQEIARKAGAMYDKFVNFVSDLEEVGGRIDALHGTYQRAHNRLVSGRGSLVARAESMKTLGVKSGKSLPANLVDFHKDLDQSGN